MSAFYKMKTYTTTTIIIKIRYIIPATMLFFLSLQFFPETKNRERNHIAASTNNSITNSSFIHFTI